MNALFPAIIESQWILCLLQVTVLMSVGWIVGRIALHKFPDISASVGVVALVASAGLIVLTWAGVPRPFELIANPKRSGSQIDKRRIKPAVGGVFGVDGLNKNTLLRRG